MNQPTPRVQVRHGPDNTPIIVNPHHKGAVIDYKSTALNLAAQLLAMDHALDEAQSVEAALRSQLNTTGKEYSTIYSRLTAINQKRWSVLKQMRSWWGYWMLPFSVRDSIEAELR